MWHNVVFQLEMEPSPSSIRDAGGMAQPLQAENVDEIYRTTVERGSLGI